MKPAATQRTAATTTTPTLGATARTTARTTATSRAAATADTAPAAAATEQAIARALGEDIIFGRLPPGTRLVEDSLIARFGATRHFIRAALLELERSGIVVRERNKGVAVRSLAPHEVNQIYEVRELLQRQAALRIALPAPQALIDELQAIDADYGRAVDARDFSAVHALNDRFHLRFFAGCGNPYLVQSINQYMALSLPVRAKMTADVARLQASQQDHHLMIRLLRGTDRWALAQLCVDHLQPAKDGYLQSAGTLAQSAAAAAQTGDRSKVKEPDR